MSSFYLKLIAIVTMVCDHLGYEFFPEIGILRIIGRVSFPIFCFLIAEGCRKTSNIKHYMVRLWIFALISEVFFDLMSFMQLINWDRQNVFFTLALGVTAIWLYQGWTKKMTAHGTMPPLAPKIIGLIFPITAMVVAIMLKSDYSWQGIIIIFMFYALGDKRRQRFCGIIGIFVMCFELSNGRLSLAFNGLEFYALLAMIPIMLYNGKRGYSGKMMQYGFYAFYPLHMFVIFLVYYWLNWMVIDIWMQAESAYRSINLW